MFKSNLLNSELFAIFTMDFAKEVKKNRALLETFYDKSKTFLINFFRSNLQIDTIEFILYLLLVSLISFSFLD